LEFSRSGDKQKGEKKGKKRSYPSTPRVQYPITYLRPLDRGAECTRKRPRDAGERSAMLIRKRKGKKKREERGRGAALPVTVLWYYLYTLLLCRAGRKVLRSPEREGKDKECERCLTGARSNFFLWSTLTVFLSSGKLHPKRRPHSLPYERGGEEKKKTERGGKRPAPIPARGLLSSAFSSLTTRRGRGEGPKSISPVI